MQCLVVFTILATFDFADIEGHPNVSQQTLPRIYTKFKDSLTVFGPSEINASLKISAIKGLLCPPKPLYSSKCTQICCKEGTAAEDKKGL